MTVKANKHAPLTAAEVAAFRPQAEVLRYIRAAAPSRPDAPLRVLDWGCGRGRLVAYLTAEGIDACGVDVDREPLDNGLAYFAACTPGGPERLRRLDDDGRAPFPDASFDIVVSDNVLEHVADLDAVLAEIARLTRPGGCGFHLFPARYTLREGHLMMPAVHWLPKGAARRGAIGLFTRLSIEPHWEELAGRPAAEKAAAYFAYSRDKTFYRAPGTILRACNRHGLEARLVGMNHPRLARLGALPEPLRGIGDSMLANFKAVELFLKKPEAAA